MTRGEWWEDAEGIRAEIERRLAFVLELSIEIEAEIDAEYILYGNRDIAPNMPRGILEA